jgi:hypothetical protein
VTGWKESADKRRCVVRWIDPARRFPKPKNDLHLGAGDVPLWGTVIGFASRNQAHSAAALPLWVASVEEMFPNPHAALRFVSMYQMHLAAARSGHAGTFLLDRWGCGAFLLGFQAHKHCWLQFRLLLCPLHSTGQRARGGDLTAPCQKTRFAGGVGCQDCPSRLVADAEYAA